MRRNVTWPLVCLTTLLGSVILAAEPAGRANESKSPAAVEAEIKALKRDKVAWRGIQWRTCLLQGLKESREKRKPLMLWIFIDRPIDDERC